MRAAGQIRSPLRAVDFVDDLRLVGESGDRTQLCTSMARLMEMLPRMRARSHTKSSERLWPSQVTPRTGFEVDTKAMRVRLSPEKKEAELSLRERRSPVAPAENISAREILQRVSYLDYLGRLIPGGFVTCAVDGRREQVRRNGMLGVWFA